MFLKEMSYTHQGCIYVLKNTVETALFVKYYYYLKQPLLILIN